MLRPVRIRLHPQPVSVVSAGNFRLEGIVPTFPRVSAVSLGLCDPNIRNFLHDCPISSASLSSPTVNIRILVPETRFELARDRFDSLAYSADALLKGSTRR